MDNLTRILLLIAVMALTTYLIRMLPMVLFRNKIENPVLMSFLYYVPYAVLAAMTIPDIFSSTGNVWAAAIGFIAAMIVAYFGKSLIVVAVSACAVVFAADTVMHLLHLL